MDKYTCPHCLERIEENKKWYCCKEMAGETHAKISLMVSGNKKPNFGTIRFAKWVSKQTGITYKGKANADWEEFWQTARRGIFKEKDSNKDELAKCPLCKNSRVFQRVCPACFAEIDPNERTSVITVVGEKQADINQYIASLIHQIKEVLLTIRHSYIISFNNRAVELLKAFEAGEKEGLGKERAVITFRNSDGKHSFVLNSFEFDEKKSIQENKEELKHLIDSDYIACLVKAQEFSAVMEKLGAGAVGEVNSSPENDMDKFISYLRDAIITLGEKINQQAVTKKDKLKIPFGLIITGKESAKTCALDGVNTDAYVPATNTIRENYDGMWDKLHSNSESTKNELERLDEIMLVKTIEDFFEKVEYFFVTTPCEGKVDLDILNPFMSIASKLARKIIVGKDEPET